MKIPAPIKFTAQTLSFLSPGLTIRLAAFLFTKPIRHQMPKREIAMYSASRRSRIAIPAIGKDVTLYQYGEANKKILLVHGWSGRGTQLVKIADALLENGYATVSFDAPAHGTRGKAAGIGAKSAGKTTLMPEFIAAILEIEKHYGPFEAAVGHSLGGMSIINALRDGLQLKKGISIGAADIIQDIIDAFIFDLGIDSRYGILLKNHFEKKHGVEMDYYSASRAAKGVKIPMLIIHDRNDKEVPLAAAQHLAQSLTEATLMVTEGLGHRKILGDKQVIQKILTFIKT